MRYLRKSVVVSMTWPKCGWNVPLTISRRSCVLRAPEGQKRCGMAHGAALKAGRIVVMPEEIVVMADGIAVMADGIAVFPVGTGVSRDAVPAFGDALAAIRRESAAPPGRAPVCRQFFHALSIPTTSTILRFTLHRLVVQGGCGIPLSAHDAVCADGQGDVRVGEGDR